MWDWSHKMHYVNQPLILQVIQSPMNRIKVSSDLRGVFCISPYCTSFDNSKLTSHSWKLSQSSKASGEQTSISTLHPLRVKKNLGWITMTDWLLKTTSSGKAIPRYCRFLLHFSVFWICSGNWKLNMQFWHSNIIYIQSHLSSYDHIINPVQHHS